MDGNGGSGVETSSGGQPFFDECVMSSNEGAGVLCHDGGLGRFHGCDITKNVLDGVETEGGYADPLSLSLFALN
jgi:hypothetical protein